MGFFDVGQTTQWGCDDSGRASTGYKWTIPLAQAPDVSGVDSFSVGSRAGVSFMDWDGLTSAANWHIHLADRRGRAVNAPRVWGTVGSLLSAHVAVYSMYLLNFILADKT